MDPSHQEKIKQQAKQIMDKFSESLSKIQFKEKKSKKTLSGFREEGPGLDADPEFRRLFFKNAPKTEGNFIMAEKKSW